VRAGIEAERVPEVLRIAAVALVGRPLTPAVGPAVGRRPPVLFFAHLARTARVLQYSRALRLRARPERDRICPRARLLWVRGSRGEESRRLRPLFTRPDRSRLLRSMRIGLGTAFQHPHDARPDCEVYGNGLRLADLAEPLGFDSVWGVAYHFTELPSGEGSRVDPSY
jgi:hypothetical protein